jgi:hypothetical protein
MGFTMGDNSSFCSSMTQTNPDVDPRTRELQQTVADRDEQLVAAYQLIAKLNHDVQRMDIHGEHVRNMKRYVEHVHGSLSWRVTRPLRGVKYAWLWLKRTLRPAPSLAAVEQVHLTYQDWVKRHDTPSTADLSRLRERLGDLTLLPTVSVVMPTYNSRLEWLQQAVASVQAQVYPHWELCIADDASPNPDIAPYLRSLAASDPRIKVVVRTENGHISAATNSALALATGDWVAFLDHDDELSPHALFYMVEALNRHPDAQLLYSSRPTGTPTCFIRTTWSPTSPCTRARWCKTLGACATPMPGRKTTTWFCGWSSGSSPSRWCMCRSFCTTGGPTPKARRLPIWGPSPTRCWLASER